jgi:exonuclease SbcC
MTAKEEMNLKVRRDFEEEVSHILSSGSPLDLSAGGQIVIDHTLWTLKVKSGEADFEQMSAHFDRVSREFHGQLQGLNLSGFEEAKKAHESFQRETAAVEALKRQIEEILDGETYEELASLAAAAPAPGRRSMKEITEENAEVIANIRQAEAAIESGCGQIAEWERGYRSKEELLDLLVEKRGELKNRLETLRLLKPLPEEIPSAESFLSVFETKQKTLKKIEQELAERRIARAELEARGAEETAEEIETRQKETEDRFRRIESEGEAISEIRETYQSVKRSMDDKTMDPWVGEIEKVVAPLTVNRYRIIHFGKNRPPGAERADGLNVPFHVLSMGTKVGLGMALRLSMARYFLRDLEGFLLLDDPLVDMDPERQQAAAEVIRAFAEKKQVILMTCHPLHAERLGGNLIRLEGPV